MPAETLAHLLRYDNVHGRLNDRLILEGDTPVAGRHSIRITAMRNPEERLGRMSTSHLILDIFSAVKKVWLEPVLIASLGKGPSFKVLLEPDQIIHSGRRLWCKAKGQ